MANAFGGPGIVTLYNWVMMSDGRVYLYLFCSDWRVLTDKMIPIPGFRSGEKWQLHGYVDGQPAVVIPGCKVNHFAICGACPARAGRKAHECFNVDAGKPSPLPARRRTRRSK